MNDFLKTAMAAAEAGADVLLKNFGQDESRSYKADNSLFTATDKEAEQAILEVITAAHPDHAYYSEEVGAGKNTSAYEWIIDPIDGTSNFSRQLPLVSVSVALTQQGKPIVGAVFAPLTKDSFTAAEGEGAKLNGQPIHTSSTTTLDRAFIGVGSRQSADRQETARIFSELLPHIASYRAFGSFALQLCYVAAGKIDGLVGTDVAWHDGAAAALIAREAGAKVTDFTGQPWQLKAGEQGGIVAANSDLHPQILALELA